MVPHPQKTDFDTIFKLTAMNHAMVESYHQKGL